MLFKIQNYINYNLLFYIQDYNIIKILTFMWMIFGVFKLITWFPVI